MLLQVCASDVYSLPAPTTTPCRAFAYLHDQQGFGSEHERTTRLEISRRLARLKGIEFGGECDTHSIPDGPKYLIPGDTLVGELEARRLGVTTRHDLFGGVVPHAFVASKAITHPLVDDDAAAPVGWDQTFPRQVADSVLDGWTAFSCAEAIAAGKRLLAQGSVRVKSVRATAGRGQWVVDDGAALQRCIDALDPAELGLHGVVLEQNLADVKTFSVGQVWVGELVCSYHGAQSSTRDNRGELVYGGSTIHVVRGEFDGLLQTCPSPAVQLAVEQACRYHEAALACFPGLILSRINYDIAWGRDAAGNPRCGVLEQSWRIGGASGAEIAALEHFSRNPQCNAVTTASREVYGQHADAPAAATVYFHGHDPTVGMLTKFSLVQTNAHS